MGRVFAGELRLRPGVAEIREHHHRRILFFESLCYCLAGSRLPAIDLAFSHPQAGPSCSRRDGRQAGAMAFSLKSTIYNRSHPL